MGEIHVNIPVLNLFRCESRNAMRSLGHNNQALIASSGKNRGLYDESKRLTRKLRHDLGSLFPLAQALWYKQ